MPIAYILLLALQGRCSYQPSDWKRKPVPIAASYHADLIGAGKESWGKDSQATLADSLAKIVDQGFCSLLPICCLC